MKWMEEISSSSERRNVRVSDSFPRGRPKKTWNDVIRSDLKEWKDNKDIAKDRNTWKFFARNRPTHASMENRRLDEYDDDNRVFSEVCFFFSLVFPVRTLSKASHSMFILLYSLKQNIASFYCAP